MTEVLPVMTIHGAQGTAIAVTAPNNVGTTYILSRSY